FGPRAVAAALAREALAPALMAVALAGRTIDWRGADLGGQWRTRKGWSPSELRMESVSETEISTITLTEQLVSTTCWTVETLLREALRRGARILVDGGSVAYLSAAGIRALAASWRRSQDFGARLVLCRFAGAAADSLMVSGFNQLLEVAPSLE